MTIKNHIILITASLNCGGSERIVSEIANYLASKPQYKITIITLGSPQDLPFYPLDEAVDLLQIDQTQNYQQCKLIRISNIVRRIFCLRKMIYKLKSDLIISFVDMMNITTLIAISWLQIPIIVSERTHPGYYKIPNLYRIFRNWLYPKAAYVVMQTNSAASYFKKVSNNFKLSIIPNPVKQPVKIKADVLSVLSNVRHIISVGRLCPFKGFDTLIRAFASIIEQDPETDLILTIYGEGAERANLENLIATLSLQNKVFLPGITKNIPDILINADLFVFPSHYEGFPNALAEAMAVGLPVIASNCSGNIDIVEDYVNGRLFPIDDSEMLFNIMQELINDVEQRKQLSANATKITEQFSETQIYAMWENIINSATT